MEKDHHRKAKTLFLMAQSTSSPRLSLLTNPFNPPKVMLETSCFNLNVLVLSFRASGHLDYDARTILLSIQSLLGEYRKVVMKLYELV
ncbi:ubiquitin-conjugating enzyme E2 20-like isoform X1 [Typha latifolia]|uniref:ubiquitin-conjugating enzyme E2 20-like isoform X1 n=1 Tax=Typha latifolia TaxID=4733 RepID=UPI003C2FE7CA